MDDALSHADEMVGAAGGNEWTIVSTSALALLVSWIRVVRPVPTEHADDFNRWQDHIDAAASGGL